MTRLTVNQLGQKLDDHLGFIKENNKEIKAELKEINKNLKEQNSKVFNNHSRITTHLKKHDDDVDKKNHEIRNTIAITSIIMAILFFIVEFLTNHI